MEIRLVIFWHFFNANALSYRILVELFSQQDIRQTNVSKISLNKPDEDPHIEGPVFCAFSNLK